MTSVTLLPMTQIRVVVVDRQRTFADALAARLDLEDDVAATGVVLTAGSAMGTIVQRRADIFLLDGDVPGNAACHLCAQISARAVAPGVIMLSATSEAERIVHGLRSGAVAWVGKDESIELLLQVVRGAGRGEAWLPPAALARVLRLLLTDQDERRSNNRLFAALTAREREVLFRLSQGARRQDVAEQLHLSDNTVRTHLQSLMGKLGVHSTLEAVALTRSRLDRLPLPGGSERW